MDYDSSTKFISSLAKFLQSLCNGYVEFDNGVQVIGHLYLNVDTGKTIDYVLNEKVCKTDENSVTFISNSFHAQPAEKPKPPGKQNDQDSEKNLKAEDLENSNQAENRPSNASRNQSSNSLAGTKRPMSPQKQSKQDRSGRASPKSKKSRTDFDSVDSTLSENIDSNSAAAYQQSLSHEASFNESYQQNFFPNDENSLGDGQEQRDVKPTFDTDVTFIKEEYAPSSGLQAENQDDGNQVDNSSAYSHSYSNQQFHPGGYTNQSSFNSSNQRSSFNPAGDRSMFNSGTSQMEGGDISNDPSESCNEESSALLSLEEVHALLDQKGMAYCLWCTSKRKSLSEYIHHVTSQHHDVQPVVCSSCGQVFAHHASFLAHIPSADMASSHYDLAFISKITKTLGEPSVRSSKRLVGGLYECRTCKKKFRQSCSLFRHRWKCEGTRSFTCKICDGVFYRRDHFKRHLLNSHGVVYQANPR